ncbi:MAG: dTDP-glucose 4,6-dehydratase [Coriobacteriales bacterium]|jgi:dTDP-glucose 4,6-dehydratase|nr:dTDP-glucose 4,6-dehydratase [Coriobacteriales bacterium]
MKNILVTGGAGFIGSNYVRYVLENFPDFELVNLDALTYAGNLENLSDIEANPQYHFVRGDIRDAELLRQLFDKYHFDAVVNFAAESHVDRSITDPSLFFEVNVGGVLTLLEACLKAWRLRPEDKYCHDFQPGVRYLQVSTDEVYGSLTPDEPAFTEQNPLAPNSPYAASKASADLLCRAYAHTYGLPLNITRCSNNYGPYQFPEKLIPLMLNNAQHDRKLPVYGDGQQIRDWLYVFDHNRAIHQVLTQAEPGQVYNIGGSNERANLQIVELLLKSIGKPDSLIEHVKDRPGHDRRYAIDSSKIRRELGWAPAYQFEQALPATITWYQEHATWVEHAVSGEYQNYYDKMYGAAER